MTCRKEIGKSREKKRRRTLPYYQSENSFGTLVGKGHLSLGVVRKGMDKSFEKRETMDSEEK